MCHLCCCMAWLQSQHQSTSNQMCAKARFNVQHGKTLLINPIKKSQLGGIPQYYGHLTIQASLIGQLGTFQMHQCKFLVIFPTIEIQSLFIWTPWLLFFTFQVPHKEARGCNYLPPCSTRSCSASFESSISYIMRARRSRAQ